MLAALGIILLVAGAIVAFALDVSVDSVDMTAVGWIMMAGGGLALIVAAIRGAGWMSMTNNKLHTERHVSDDGRHYVEETHSA